MSERNRDADKWVFVAGLSLLGAIFIWQIQKYSNEDDLSFRPVEIPTAYSPPPDYTPVAGSRYSETELRYFHEIAFGSEHVRLPEKIRKWTSDITVRLEGDPTGDDLLAVQHTINQINSLQDSVTLSIGYFESNMIIRFVPESSFQSWHGNYRPKNPGYFWTRWINEEIYAAGILIDTEETSQRNRIGLIKEEMTQSLGLMNVSSRYKDSIFNDDANSFQASLSPMDRKLVEMLYRPEILPSMTPQEAIRILAEIPHD